MSTHLRTKEKEVAEPSSATSLKMSGTTGKGTTHLGLSTTPSWTRCRVQQVALFLSAGPRKPLASFSGRSNEDHESPRMRVARLRSSAMESDLDHSSPRTIRRTLAAFDFDGTLVRGDSQWRFLARAAGKVPTLLTALGHAPSLLGSFFPGSESKDQVKEEIFSEMLAGKLPLELRTLGTSFARELVQKARPEVVARLHWHRSQGHIVVVISASLDLYVEPAASLLGANATLATRMEIGSDGRFTGRIEGRNCRGEEKARRLAEWLSLHGGRELFDLWAYGNSAGDKELLEMADHPVNVGRLGRMGTLRAFPRLEDQASRKRVPL
jgi:phosphatidylglycerophosphatase C